MMLAIEPQGNSAVRAETLPRLIPSWNSMTGEADLSPELDERLVLDSFEEGEDRGDPPEPVEDDESDREDF